MGDFPIAQQGDTSCRVIEFEACIPGEVADPAPRFCAEVVHCPTKEPDNFAHTEIRVRPLGAEYKEDWRPKSDYRRMLLKEKVASFFRLLPL